jgi:hypothetical protein
VGLVLAEPAQSFAGLQCGDIEYARAIAARIGIELGAGVTCIQFDEGWSLDHPAFSRFHAAGGAVEHVGRWPIDAGRSAHGTSILGMQIGEFDAAPLLPGARFVLVCAIDHEEEPASRLLADAIERVADVGVVLIARDWSSRAPHIPLELRAGIEHPLSIAAERGITVVEAAGNGGLDLDQLVRRDGPGVYRQVSILGDPWAGRGDLISPAFTADSGAIVAGAATRDDPPQRWTAGFGANPQPKSNFGARVDCWAIGEGVLTASTDAAKRPTWDNAFGGTSAAAASIASIVAMLQSLVLHWPGRQSAFTPTEIRQFLRDPTLGAPVWDGDRPVGVLPSLRLVIERALETERSSFHEASPGFSG